MTVASLSSFAALSSPLLILAQFFSWAPVVRASPQDRVSGRAHACVLGALGSRSGR